MPCDATAKVAPRLTGRVWQTPAGEALSRGGRSSGRPARVGEAVVLGTTFYNCFPESVARNISVTYGDVVLRVDGLGRAFDGRGRPIAPTRCEDFVRLGAAAPPVDGVSARGMDV